MSMSYWLFESLQWLRFGRIVSETKAIDGGYASEIEYRGRFGRVVGYYAYGSFDPSLPWPWWPEQPSESERRAS